MSGKGNDAYEKLSREMGEKYGHLYQRLDLNTPGVRYAPTKPEREFKPYLEQEDEAMTAKTMAEVLAEHVMCVSSTDGSGTVEVTCQCGHESTGTELDDHEHGDSYRIHTAHQAAALSAAGFGLVADAQAEPGSAMQEAMRLAWDEGKNAVWTFMSNQDPRRERPTNPYHTEASS